MKPFCQIRWTDDDRAMGRVTRSNEVKLEEGEGGGGDQKAIAKMVGKKKEEDKKEEKL